MGRKYRERGGTSELIDSRCNISTLEGYPVWLSTPSGGVITVYTRRGLMFFLDTLDEQEIYQESKKCLPKAVCYFYFR